MTGGIVGVDVPLWVKFQSNIDPSIAPKGHYVQTWAMLLERGAPMDEEHLLHTESRLRRILCEVLPGALDCIVQQRKIYIPVVNGNILTPAQSYPHRPAIVSEDVRNLYFIGDTTRATGCSGDIAFQSALDLEAQLANE
jgi:phytoene dehydrogenase-like protein